MVRFQQERSDNKIFWLVSIECNTKNWNWWEILLWRCFRRKHFLKWFFNAANELQSELKKYSIRLLLINGQTMRPITKDFAQKILKYIHSNGINKKHFHYLLSRLLRPVWQKQPKSMKDLDMMKIAWKTRLWLNRKT